MDDKALHILIAHKLQDGRLLVAVSTFDQFSHVASR